MGPVGYLKRFFSKTLAQIFSGYQTVEKHCRGIFYTFIVTSYRFARKNIGALRRLPRMGSLERSREGTGEGRRGRRRRRETGGKEEGGRVEGEEGRIREEMRREA